MQKLTLAQSAPGDVRTKLLSGKIHATLTSVRDQCVPLPGASKARGSGTWEGPTDLRASEGHSIVRYSEPLGREEKSVG